jgi:hypothetical protein
LPQVRGFQKAQYSGKMITPEHKKRVFLYPDRLGLIRYNEKKYCVRIARVRQNTNGDSAGL